MSRRGARSARPPASRTSTGARSACRAHPATAKRAGSCRNIGASYASPAASRTSIGKRRRVPRALDNARVQRRTLRSPPRRRRKAVLSPQSREGGTMQAGRTALLALVLSTPCFAHHGVAPHYDARSPCTSKASSRNSTSSIRTRLSTSMSSTPRATANLELRDGVAQRAVAQRPDGRALRSPARRSRSTAMRLGTKRRGARFARRISPTAACCGTRRCSPRRTPRTPTFLPTANRS